MGKGKKKKESPAERGKRILEELERKEQEQAKLFDISEIIMDAERIREVYVPEINRIVRFKKLTVAQDIELSKIEDPNRKALKMLYFMLHAADPKVTEESIERMPNDVAAAILRAILPKAFLQATDTRRLRLSLSETRQRRR